MSTIEQRLSALEQTQRHTTPPLLLYYRSWQEGKPTPEQAGQIAIAERFGREVTIIEIRRAEDSFP